MPSKRGRRVKVDKGKEKDARYSVYITLTFLVFVFILSLYLYLESIIPRTDSLVWASVAQSLIFSFAVFAYMLIKGLSFKEMINQLGLSKETITGKNLLYGLILFFIVLALEFGLGLFEVATGIQLPTNVSQVFSGLPAYFLAFSIIVAPINEEILFRGFLVPKVGIFISAFIFGFLHYLSYASVSEFLTAFIFGVAAGYIRQKTGSLYPSITAHIIVNLLGLLILGGM